MLRLKAIFIRLCLNTLRIVVAQRRSRPAGSFIIERIIADDVFKIKNQGKSRP